MALGFRTCYPPPGAVRGSEIVRLPSTAYAQATSRSWVVCVTPDDESADDDPTETRERASERGRREVVVPERLYRTVTVFSTLIAIVGVVAGFVLLDMATKQATASFEEVNVWLASLGILAILGGGATYAYAARFQAEGMRKDKDATDEPSNNG